MGSESGWSGEAIAQAVRLRWNIVPVQNGNEWHSPCPFCPDHGTDRFIIRTTGRYWCRKCDAKGWIDENLPNAKHTETAEERTARMAAERAEREANLERWRNSAEAQAYLRYHANQSPENLAWWEGRGITAAEVERYKLGFCPQKTFKADDGTRFSSSAYTVPILRGGCLLNVTYRLNEVPPALKAGKYRQVFDIPQALFYAEEGTRKRGILLEGAIKAMVVYRFIGGAMQVIGSPGITPHPSVLEDLLSFDELFFIPDPDASTAQVDRFVRVLGRRIKLVEMPVKPDDAFTVYGLREETFRTDYLRIGDWDE